MYVCILALTGHENNRPLAYAA